MSVNQDNIEKLKQIHDIVLGIAKELEPIIEKMELKK